MEVNLEHLKYPVGRFKLPPEVTMNEIREAVNTIAAFPSTLHETVSQLSAKQIETPYRPEGWTVRQVVHHCADSHMNALIRFKLALTEDQPVIKPYEQAKWASLADNNLSLDVSLTLLNSVHQRWVAVMEAMEAADWKRSFIHPEYGNEQRLEQAVMLYAWHCRHHGAHVLLVRENAY